MICFAFPVPRAAGRGPLVVVMILEMENLHRMQKADPFDIKLADLNPPSHFGAKDIDLVIAYEDDREALIRFQQTQDIDGLMVWLERGRHVRSEDLVPPRPITPETKQ